MPLTPPAGDIRATILAMHAAGASAAQIAYALREIGARTAAGGDWTQRAVLALIARAKRPG